MVDTGMYHLLRQSTWQHRLLSSQRTLITGLVSTTLDTIKIACSLAECIHASVDANAPENSNLTTPTAIRVGDVTADFEELRDRADLAIFWGSNPTFDCPRFIERFIKPVPCGAARRTISVGPRPVLPQSCITFISPSPKINWSAWLVSCRLKLKKATRESHRDLENIACQLKKSIDTAHCIGFISTKQRIIRALSTGAFHISREHLLTENLHSEFGSAQEQLQGRQHAGATVCTWRFGSPGAIPRRPLLEVNSFPQKLMHGV